MTKIVRKLFAVHFHCFWSSCWTWPTTQIFYYSGSCTISIFGAYIGTSGKLSQVAGLGCSEKIIDKNFEKVFLLYISTVFCQVAGLGLLLKYFITQVAVNFPFLRLKLEHQVN